MSFKKLLLQILSGDADDGIRFESLCILLKRIGFKERIKGSHHIFHRETIEEIINIQPVGKKAKGYQVKQIRDIIVKYNLGGRS